MYIGETLIFQKKTLIFQKKDPDLLKLLMGQGGWECGFRFSFSRKGAESAKKRYFSLKSKTSVFSAVLMTPAKAGGMGGDLSYQNGGDFKSIPLENNHILNDSDVL